MGASVIIALICAFMVGACCWLLLGWEREDAERTLASWRARLFAEVRLLAKAVATVAAQVSGMLRLQREHDAVSLGEVSEMIDIIRLGLSAGLSFDAALGLYCEGRDGALAERMACARLLWQTGVASRERALEDAARDTGVRALETFAMAVGQALELGAPLTETLAGQSREIRAAHRAEVERQIERAPVKLLIPTGTLILPALLVSIIGPLLAAGGML